MDDIIRKLKKTNYCIKVVYNGDITLLGKLSSKKIAFIFDENQKEHPEIYRDILESNEVRVFRTSEEKLKEIIK